MKSLCPLCGGERDESDSFCRHCGASSEGETGPPSAPVPPDIEQRLRTSLAPQFQLIKKLGEGGMGSVYLARDPVLQRMIAVKVLAPELAQVPEARRRFEREAQSVAAVSHPNIVSIFSVGELPDDTPYFLMEFVSGKSLEERIRDDGPMSPKEAKAVVGQIGSALAAAHEAGIIHRDIKPANVIQDANTGRVLVSDFGISALLPRNDLGGGAATKLTQAGMSIGTPAYMSPEQIAADEVTDRSDVYSLGVVAYELLTGSGPYEISTPQEAIAAHLRDTPKKLSEMGVVVEAEFENLITSCLEKAPDGRPTAAEIAKRLLPQAGGLLEWPPPGLGALHGAMPRLSRILGIGEFLVVVPTLFLLTQGPRVASPFSSLPVLALLLAAMAGVVVLGVGTKVLGSAARAVARALRNGYATLTILEVAADRRRDTGQLIAGINEYATLDPLSRNRLRRRRFLRELAAFGAAMVPLPLLVFGIWIGSAGAIDPTSISIITLAPSILLLVWAIECVRVELRLVRKARKLSKRRRLAEDVGPLVEPWYGSFETVRRGQQTGRGLPAKPAFGWWGALIVALSTIVIAIVLTPILVIGFMGPAIQAASRPRFTRTLQIVKDVELFRPFILSVDSPSTAAEARRAYYSLARPDSGVLGSATVTWQPLPEEFPDISPGPYADDMFQSSLSTTGRRRWTGPDPNTVIESATRGFSDAETQWLSRLEQNPIWDSYSTLARARVLDPIAARFVLPLPESVTLRQIPVPRFATIRTAAYAAPSRAASYLAQGRPDDAERVLRETISVGFLMIDHGPTILENLIGAIIARIGGDALEDLYVATARPEAAVIRMAKDSATSRNDIADEGSTQDARTPTVDPITMRHSLMAIAADRQIPKGIRLETLQILTTATCLGNVREALFGPEPELVALFNDARSEFSRLPGDSALVNTILSARERQRDFDTFLPRFIYGVTNVSGMLLMNRRISGCTGAVLAGII